MDDLDNIVANLCPICLAPATVNTEAGQAHLLTHDREQLITVIRALSNDLSEAIPKSQEG